MTNEPALIVADLERDVAHITGVRHYQLLPLMLAAVAPSVSMDDLIAEAMECMTWKPPRPSRWVEITEEEFVELGIPNKSERGISSARFCGRVLVDRRCLKRYRRKAGRRV